MSFVSKSRSLAFAAVAISLLAIPLRAQLSLSSAVDLALRNSPRVKLAQADLDKAKAAVAESQHAYIPAVSTVGGYGGSSGVPLSLPVVFSISAQSLVFTYSQRDYIRAAHLGVASATAALSEVRSQVAEDTANTYVTLNSALQRRAALTEAAGYAGKLVQITQDRFDSGVDPKIETTRSRRTAVALKLQQLRVEDEIADLTSHLGRLTGITNPAGVTDPSSIPAFPAPSDSPGSLTDSDGLRAAFLNANAKALVAHGDNRYRWRPQVAFSSSYNRISTVGTDYADYYPRFANDAFSHNSFNIGISFTIPLLDLVHQDKARESAADARHAQYEAEYQRMQFLDGRLKMEHAASELSARSELASLDRDLAQNQLETVELQLQASAANPDAPQLTPKDQQNAHLQERQKFLDFLDADLQLRQTQITLLRQNGRLGEWLHATITAQPAAPHTAIRTTP